MSGGVDKQSCFLQQKNIFTFYGSNTDVNRKIDPHGLCLFKMKFHQTGIIFKKLSKFKEASKLTVKYGPGSALVSLIGSDMKEEILLLLCLVIHST